MSRRRRGRSFPVDGASPESQLPSAQAVPSAAWFNPPVGQSAESISPQKQEENMTTRGSGMKVSGLLASLVLGTLVLTPARGLAHCDGLDGPVVTAARLALEKNEVTRALIWVRRKDEPEIRKAFEQTQAVRKLSTPARELADTYFFETLVRVHRAGEGAPYTGLRPAGRDLGPAIPGADHALETGDVEPLVRLLVDAAEKGVRQHFAEARAARNYPAGHVEAGREYIEKYVPFIHYIERLYQSATAAAPGHEAEAGAAVKHQE